MGRRGGRSLANGPGDSTLPGVTRNERRVVFFVPDTYLSPPMPCGGGMQHVRYDCASVCYMWLGGVEVGKPSR